jgi:hypothetical protein
VTVERIMPVCRLGFNLKMEAGGLEWSEIRLGTSISRARRSSTPRLYLGVSFNSLVSSVRT